MSKALLVFACLAAAVVLYREYGDQLPQGVTYRPSGDGVDTPAPAGIVNSGTTEAAGGLKP